MTNKIPPSLNWLIDKRARVAGEIAKTKRSLKEAKTLIKDLEELEIKLSAIDTTLDLHDIKVDVNLIVPIESHEIRVNIPHGELSKSILTCIRLYQVNGPVPKPIIENFVITRHFDFDGEKVIGGDIKRIIHNGLTNLYHKGYLIKHHDPKSNNFSLWTLSKKCTID